MKKLLTVFWLITLISNFTKASEIIRDTSDVKSDQIISNDSTQMVKEAVSDSVKNKHQYYKKNDDLEKSKERIVQETLKEWEKVKGIIYR